MHEKKEKGDLAAIKAIADLSEKGYSCFIPVVTEHLPFDFIAYKDEKSFRIQVKYSRNNKISNCTSWSDKNGTHRKKYNECDFDYYAIYFPDINKMLYPSIKFGGCKISSSLPNSSTHFYWWEDFIEFTDEANRKTLKDFGLLIKQPTKRKSLTETNISWPTKEELKLLIQTKSNVQLGKDFGVSGTTIASWIKAYDLSK